MKSVYFSPPHTLNLKSQSPTPQTLSSTPLTLNLILPNQKPLKKCSRTELSHHHKVFNEMKGVYSSPDAVHGRTVQQVFFLLFFTLVSGPKKSLSLQLSDTRVYEP